METLTDKDKELLGHIEAHYAATGFPFSLAEAAECMGMSKGSVIAGMVGRLEAANVIEYAANRKYYRPTRWRELVAGATPDPNATPEFEALTARVAELEAEADELRRKLKAKPKATNAELERIRKLNAERQKRYKQKKRQGTAAK